MADKEICKECGSEKKERVVLDISKTEKEFQKHGKISVLININGQFVSGGVCTSAEFLDKLKFYLSQIGIEL